MVPSTYEDGTLYNVLPSGNKAPDETGNHNGYDQTRADFSFSRGSNLAATRVNADGLIEKGRENLLLQSNQFDTTWTKSVSITTTSGQSDRDSGTDAWLLKRSDAAARYIQQNVSFSGVNTFSFYAKAESEDWIYWNSSSGNAYGYINVNNGTIGTNVGALVISQKATSVGNGYYRVEAVVNATLTYLRLYPAIGDGSIVGSVTDAGVYIQDAQLEKGLVSTPYIETGATTAKAGILEDMPRIDYTSGTGALLLEGLRSNLAHHSEYFDGWSHKPNVTATTNYITSPEGLKNATRLQFTANGYLYNSNAPAQVNGTQYTLSCYAKRNDSGTQSFGFFTNGSGSVDSAMVLTSEWKRFDYTYTASNVSQLGLAGNSGADVSVYGFQVESGASYPSSYIPSYGSAVTRSADSWYADNIGQTTAYTIFIDYDSLEQAESNFQDYISFQASGSTQDGLRAEGVGSEWRLYGYNISGSVTFPIAGSINKKKKAIVVSTAGIKLFEDGALTNQDLGGMTIPALGAIVSKRGTSAPYPTEIKQAYKQIAVFNEALSDAECISLTS